MTKKQDLVLRLLSKKELGGGYYLLDLVPNDSSALPQIAPGQFVEILVPDHRVLLRRPISICDVDVQANNLRLMIAAVGTGTCALIDLPVGSTLQMLIPLGNGFTITPDVKRPLLVGGGVGIAPLLYLSRALLSRHIHPTVLLGARTAEQLRIADYFPSGFQILYTTEDGSMGEKGFVTNHTALREQSFSHIYTCGPRPMMEAVARYAAEQHISCEVSLENTMACGVGACLCCVEDTIKGNRCVCTEGPVFNIMDLKWL